MNWLAESSTCPGLFYGTPAQDGFLIRIRVPGGLLNHRQAEAIAALSNQWGNETIQITNRANLQIRSVETAPTAEAFQLLQTLGLAAHNPHVDHLRNLMASPTAGIDPQELIDTRPFVQALDYYIQNHPELADLPAKFSIGIDGGGTVGIGTRSAIPWEHRYNDIQLTAVKENQVYFRLSFGREQSWDAQVLIQPDECVSVVAALANVYLSYVRQVPQTQKRLRMKHLLQDWGLDKYLEQVNRQLSHPLQQVKNCPVMPPTQRYGHLGVHSQPQVGLSYIGVGLRLGQLTAIQLLELVHLSRTYGSSHLRLTPWQTVVLPDITNHQVADVLQNLSSVGLFASGSRAESAIAACAGKPGCAASATHTQADAIALINALNRFTLEVPINIHLTGCAKLCAQSSPAEITLLGTTIEHNGEVVEVYRVFVGQQERSLQQPLCEVTAAELPALIQHLLNLYKRHRSTPDEAFGEFAEEFAEYFKGSIGSSQSSDLPKFFKAATVYTQIASTPSNSPLERGRTLVSPLGKGGLSGVDQD